MRAFLSIGALVIIAFVVLKLSSTQVSALAPATGTAGSAPARSAAEQAADKVTRAVAAGAALRADDAASR